MSLLQNLLKLTSAHWGQNGRILGSRVPILFTQSLDSENDLFYTQKRYAARKGKRIAATREKQRLARQRREELKNAPVKVWKPPKLLVDKRLNSVSKKFDDSDRKSRDEIVDNVYLLDQYKEQKLSFADALAFIRETHDASLYDEPDALLEAKVELNLKTKKKSKFVENFKGIISFTNPFAHGTKRKIVAICKSEEDQEAAKKAGADLVGSTDIIQMLKTGEFSVDNFDELVCHGDLLIELASIRKAIGNYFPSKSRGNIGFDMTRLVRHFVYGLEYKLTKDDFEQDYGFVRLPFGRLSQSDQELRENFEAALSAIDNARPSPSPGDFITRTLILSEPCPELFPVSFWNHIGGYEEANLEEEETTGKVSKAARN